HPHSGEIVAADVARVRLDGLVAGLPGYLPFGGLLVGAVGLAVRLPGHQGRLAARGLEAIRILGETLFGEHLQLLDRRRVVAPLPEVVPARHPFGRRAGTLVHLGRGVDDLRRHLQTRWELVGRSRWTRRLA